MNLFQPKRCLLLKFTREVFTEAAAGGCSAKKSVLKKFGNIHRKTPYLFNKVAGQKNTYFEEHLRPTPSVFRTLSHIYALSR